MTVKELIERLRELPEDMRVFADAGYGELGHADVERVKLKCPNESVPGADWYQRVSPAWNDPRLQVIEAALIFGRVPEQAQPAEVSP